MKIDTLDKELQKKVVTMLNEAEDKSEAIYQAAVMIAEEQHKHLISELVEAVSYTHLIHTENLTSFKLQEYAQDQIAGIAKFGKVPQENIRIIKRQEYVMK